MKAVWVATAGALGALTRYGIGLAVGPVTFPWVTLVINVSGAFVLGAVLTLAPARHWSPVVSTAIAVGFLGAYTTFSTFSWETFVLGRVEDRWVAAVLYVGASVVLGVAAAWAGHAVARSVTT
jgi:fluoride exporter